MIKQISLLIILAISFSSCYKSNCPSLDMDVVNYMPYKANEVIEFVGENGIASDLEIGNIEVYETNERVVHKNECGCLVFHRTRLNFLGKAFMVDFDFAENFKNAPYYTISNSLPYSKHELEYVVNNMIIHDVIIYEKKTDDLGFYKRIVIAKNIGIISIELSNGRVFNLKNLSLKKNLKTSDLDITYIC